MKRPYYLIFAISAFIMAGMFMLAQKEIFVHKDGVPLIILSILLLICLIFITIRIKAVKNKEPFQHEYSKGYGEERFVCILYFPVPVAFDKLFF